MPEYVWIVREEVDKTEGRGGTRIAAYCSSEEAAMDVNKDIDGVMGIPRTYGGSVSKITLDTRPTQVEEVWGYRKDRSGQWGYGWVDNRDTDPQCREDDPEWHEYKRLHAKFNGTPRAHTSDLDDPYSYRRP